MEVVIKFKTPGDYLSMRSMFGVVSSIRREIEIAISDVLHDEFPLASKEYIRKQVRKRVDLSLKDAQKGSWEVILFGSVAGAIGGITAALVSDLITKSDKWERFRNDVYSISEKVSHKSEERLSKKKSLGPFKSEYKLLKAKKRTNGVPVLEVDVELSRRSKGDMQIDMEKEVDLLIDQLQKKT